MKIRRKNSVFIRSKISIKLLPTHMCIREESYTRAKTIFPYRIIQAVNECEWMWMNEIQCDIDERLVKTWLNCWSSKINGQMVNSWHWPLKSRWVTTGPIAAWLGTGRTATEQGKSHGLFIDRVIHKKHTLAQVCLVNIQRVTAKGYTSDSQKEPGEVQSRFSTPKDRPADICSNCSRCIF